jgi:4'-phosphopantetheinyl transferase
MRENDMTVMTTRDLFDDLRASAAEVPELRTDECQVWWTSLAHCADWHTELLDQTERQRRRQYLRAADRDRFTMGAVLTRLVLAAQLGIHPASVPLDRTCARCGAPHGRPCLPAGAALDFSISHSGDLIALAVTRNEAGARRAVGVDVEQISAAIAGEAPVDIALSPAEVVEFGQLSITARPMAFFRYWVRKEAVLKATGDGLRVPMTQLTLSGPDQPPRLIAWQGRPGFSGSVTIHDLEVKPGYAAALAIIGRDAVVSCHDAAVLVGMPRLSHG